jgi:hypothetical protein
MIVEDFTNLGVGQLVPLEGTVARCPRCGRNGIEEHPVMTDAYFLHVQVSEVLPDGLRAEQLDCCALPSPN